MGSGDFTIRCVDTDQSGRLLTCSRGWGRNVVWNQASWLALIHAGGQREISTLCELVSYTTLRCGLVPSHCGLVIIAGWKRRTTGQSATLLQRMMDVFLIQFSAHFLQRPEGRQSKSKQTRLSSQKIWPETISLSGCNDLAVYSNLRVANPIQSIPFFPRTRFFLKKGWCRTSQTVPAGRGSRRAGCECRGVAVCFKSPAVRVAFQLWKSVFWAGK